MTDQTRTYAANVAAYAEAGWPCIIPVPPADKFPPPAGFTGADGADTDAITMVMFSGSHPNHSIALRMPDGVIGIDVDHYDKTSTLPDGTTKTVAKRGADVLAKLEAELGELPATWSSTARGDRHGPGPSRVLLFRVPPQRYRTALEDVEIIQRHHRYQVVAPSLHTEGGRYTWYDLDGQPTETVPGPDDLPALPPAWVDFLAAGAAQAGPAAADAHAGRELLVQITEDWSPPCAHITSLNYSATADLDDVPAGSRHDRMTAHVHHLVQSSANGHTGAAGSVMVLREAWDRLTAGEERGAEFDSMLLTSARKAVTVVGSHRVVRDPCLVDDAFLVPGAAPEGVDGTPGENIDPGRRFSVREIIGTHAFDTPAQLDQPLAQAVLARTYPAVRYAFDSRGWLLRVPDRWELHGDLTQWAVAQVAGLLPIGNPDAEKGSDEHERSKRRARFNTQAGAKAIASKMSALVAGGTHPCAVKLGHLDSEPHLLWAGGYPWDLRRCLPDAPIEDWVDRSLDPATPHLHTAGVTPERKDTPLWDAFLAAIWPDPELRAYAVRVLSIALTGYADRALPILIGETGRGKTQVISLIMSVLGSYAHAADPRLMGAEGAKAHASIVFALKGRRLSFIDEGPREGKWAQERLKQLTGGGELTANQMNQNPITFRPTHTLVLTTNEEPALTDPAIRSRARLIPCDGDAEAVRLTRAAIGHLSGEAWRAEAPGVLAKLMSEAAQWLADPTTAHVSAAPAWLRDMAEKVGAEQDPIRVWLEEETEPWPAGTASRELYRAFWASCRSAGIRPDVIPSETKWGRSLTRWGYDTVHTEHGKKRPLRVRQTGFLPEGPQPAPTVPAVVVTPNPDGLTPNPDGLLTGSETNPSGVFTQVNAGISVDADGSDGLTDPLTHMHAHTRLHEASGSGLDKPVSSLCETAAIPANPTQPNPSAASQTPATPAKKAQTESARARKLAEKAAKRTAAIAEAGGPVLELPALVTRDGDVRPISAEDADRLLGTITRTLDALTVDVEHTGYPVGHADYALRTIQLGNENFAVVLHARVHAEIAGRHLEAATVLHAHSATADIVPLAHAGIIDAETAWAKMHDTVIPAKLADPASTGSDPSLKKLAAAMLGDQALSPAADAARAALFKAGGWLIETKSTTPIERSGWAQVDSGSQTMIRYAASDVIDDAALAKRLPELPAAILERERTAQRMTARIAHHGVRLDPETVGRLHAEQSADLAAATERIRAFGVDNPGSDAQVAAALERLGADLPRTNTGKPSVARGALDGLKGADGDLGELVDARLAYQIAENRLGLFLNTYLQLIERGDGRARPTVYTLGADTGRMSCVRPNLQQVPREGGFRGCITADPGHVLISADFAGVELRVAAALSGDQNLREIVDDPARDIHREIAQVVWGSGAGKAKRYQAKRKVFGRIYGSGLNGLVTSDPPVSEAIARKIIDAMDLMTPGLSEWSRQTRDAVQAGRVQFPTYAGRIVHLDKRNPHKAPNYCIQGTARELLIDALIAWQATKWGGAVVLPVHDELVAMVPEDEADEATAALEQCMTNELHGVDIRAEASEPSFAWSDSV